MEEPKQTAKQQNEDVKTAETPSELDVLVKEREQHVTRLFWLALEIALIFLLPALAVVYIAGNIWSKQVAWYLLPFSFVLSWVIVFVRYRSLSKKLQGLDARIRELRNKQ